MRHVELDIGHSSAPTLYTPSDTQVLEVVSTWTPTLRYFSVVQPMFKESIMLPSMTRAVKAFCLKRGIATSSRAEDALAFGPFLYGELDRATASSTMRGPPRTGSSISTRWRRRWTTFLDSWEVR